MSSYRGSPPLPESSTMSGRNRPSSAVFSPVVPSSSQGTFRRTHRSTSSLSSLTGVGAISGPTSPSLLRSPSILMDRGFGSSTSWQGGINNAALVAEETQNKVFCNCFNVLTDTVEEQERGLVAIIPNRRGAEHTKEELVADLVRLNSRIVPLGQKPLSDLSRDFADGTRLIQLIEALTGESLGRYNGAPSMTIQKAENAKLALDTIKEMGVHFTNIGPEDIIGGNRKLILGLIWVLLQRLIIADIVEEGSNAKDGLLLWCQKRTQPYSEVTVTNFTRSFQDGLAFCALIHRHRPDLLDYDSLPKGPAFAAQNTRLAFKVAHEQLGIPILLDVEDVCESRRPDERSIMTYVAQYFHCFSSKAREETEAKIVNKFVDHVGSLLVGIHDYTRRASEFLESINALLHDWNSSPPTPPYASLKAAQASFVDHKQKLKREWVKEKGEIMALLSHIQTKLKTYGLKTYEPEEDLSPGKLDQKWRELLVAEAERSRTINALIRTIKEAARMRFATLANDFQANLQKVASELAAVTGPLDRQEREIGSLQKRLTSLSHALTPLSEAERLCVECNVDENDHTVYSFDDLQYEYSQLSSNVTGRAAFVANQIVSRSMTNVTPELLEEFESAFRAFDKDGSNTLDSDELYAALGSLGVSDVDVEIFLEEVAGTAISFETFTKYLVDRAEDRLSADKVRSTFRAVAGDKGFITELDLSRLQLPQSSLEFLREHMPADEVNATQEEGTAYNFLDFLDALLD